MSTPSELLSSLQRNIRDYYGVEPERLIPLHAPCFNEQEKRLVAECVDSTFVSSVGEYVIQFEQQVADFVGAKQGVAVVNGTAGLMLALRVVGVKPNELVLTQSLTFVATANAIAQLCAEPLFLDVDKTSLGLSAAALETYLQTQTEQQAAGCFDKQTGKRIAACVPMHTLGMPCEIERIVELCHQYQIPVVEDAAESLGSLIEKRHTGTIGDVGVFSFNGNKIITTGGGGVLVTNRSDFAQHAKHLSTTAKQPHPWAFEHDERGYNLRLPNLNAALGVAQMQKLPQFLKEKQQLHQLYQNFFAENVKKMPESPVLQVISAPKGSQPNYWLNGIVLRDRQKRDEWLETLNQNQIQARPLWTPLHQQPIYAQSPRQPLPHTEWLAERVVNLPSGVRCYNGNHHH